MVAVASCAPLMPSRPRCARLSLDSREHPRHRCSQDSFHHLAAVDVSRFDDFQSDDLSASLLAQDRRGVDAACAALSLLLWAHCNMPARSVMPVSWTIYLFIMFAKPNRHDEASISTRRSLPRFFYAPQLKRPLLCCIRFIATPHRSQYVAFSEPCVRAKTVGGGSGIGMVSSAASERATPPVYRKPTGRLIPMIRGCSREQPPWEDRSEIIATTSGPVRG